MIKLNMPFWASLQSFIFMPDKTILWTTASQAPWHKLVNLITKRPKMSHTSIGVDIPHHGQWLLLEGDKIIYEIGVRREVYDLNLNLLGKEKGQKLTRQQIYQLEGVTSSLLLQGVDYHEDYTYTVFGRVGKGLITIFKHQKNGTLVNRKTISYDNYDKWYLKSFEAEGIRVHPVTGVLWIGITFETIILTHQNFIEKVDI